ncbi:MAG TPA: peptide chain release factor N(5)-glutamine methyltransferase [Opitutaceae bacterium]
MLTVLEIVKRTTDFLGSKGIESPRLTSELLVGHALGLKRMQLYVQFEKPLAEADLEKIRPLVRRRAQREPLQYIFGETEWGGLKLKTDRRALIPRPETEYLLELLGEIWKGAESVPPARILDLGTGTGALALGLAHRFPSTKVIAVDRSADALALARENAASLGLAERVEFCESNWYSNLGDIEKADGRFDLIVANPPYLSARETAEAQPEVQAFEPVSALTAEEDGLADLRKIIAGAPRFLREGGLLALETGIEQHAKLTELAHAAGFTQIESKKDLTGRDRFIFAR